MLLLEAPPDRDMRIYNEDYLDSPAELALLALTLTATWAARTGRSLRDVPVGDLTPEELIAFWADDRLEPPYAPLRQWRIR